MVTFMSEKHRSISQKAARDGLGSPELFTGGAYVTRNGVTQLFIQPIEEREAEIAEKEAEEQAHALLKMALMAESDANSGRTMSIDDALQQLKDSRK